MTKLILSLEYGCYPIWLYDESGKLICNDIPLELINDKQLIEEISSLQSMYEELFTNDGITFCYNGCLNKKERSKFLLKISMIENKIKLKTNYDIVNSIHI